MSNKPITAGNAQTKCPTCGTPCTTTWSGLELVDYTGDETLATKHYHPLPAFEEMEYERLKEANEELLKALNVAKQLLVGYDMRYPKTRQLLAGYTNGEANTLIQSTFTKYNSK